MQGFVSAGRVSTPGTRTRRVRAITFSSGRSLVPGTRTRPVRPIGCHAKRGPRRKLQRRDSFAACCDKRRPTFVWCSNCSSRSGVSSAAPAESSSVRPASRGCRASFRRSASVVGRRPPGRVAVYADGFLRMADPRQVVRHRHARNARAGRPRVQRVGHPSRRGVSPCLAPFGPGTRPLPSG